MTDGEGSQSDAEETTAAVVDTEETPAESDDDATPVGSDDDDGTPIRIEDRAPAGEAPAGSAGMASSPITGASAGCDKAADLLGGEKQVDSLALLDQLRKEVEGGQVSKDRAQEILGELCGLISDAAGEEEDTGDSDAAAGEPLKRRKTRATAVSLRALLRMTAL